MAHNVPVVDNVGAIVPVGAVKIAANINAAGAAIAEKVCDDTAEAGPAVTIIGGGTVPFHFAVIQKALNTGWTAVPVEINTDGRAVMLRIGAAGCGNNCTVTHGKVSFQSIVEVFMVFLDTEAVKDIIERFGRAVVKANTVGVCAGTVLCFIFGEKIGDGCFDIGFGIGFHGMYLISKWVPGHCRTL
jgi:hypothetical protein